MKAWITRHIWHLWIVFALLWYTFNAYPYTTQGYDWLYVVIHVFALPFAYGAIAYTVLALIIRLIAHHRRRRQIRDDLVRLKRISEEYGKLRVRVTLLQQRLAEHEQKVQHLLNEPTIVDSTLTDEE